jgi:hypothetical protein
MWDALRTRRLFPLAVFSIAVYTCASLAQSPEVRIRIDQVMSGEELRETGIGSLGPTQRRALDAWLNRYTKRMLNVAVDSGRYGGIGGGHWISEVSGNGAYIKLEDGSLWEINELDRVDTSLWLAVTNITVLTNKHPIGDFKYMLVNTDDGEQAPAHYVGSR